MKEEESMDKHLEALLLEEDGNDYIRIELDDHSLSINLNSNEQNTLRDIYKELIEIALESNVILDFKCQSGYDKVLFKEISEELIKDLNLELAKIHNDVTLDDLFEPSDE